MHADDLLDHVLGQLEESRRVELGRRLADDAAIHQRAALLRQRLDLLLDDGAGPAVPAGLASRTLTLVEIRRSSRSVLEFAPVRGGLRLSDFAVAAGVFLAGLLTLIPSTQRSQMAARAFVCRDRIQHLGMGLISYAQVFNGYPRVSADGPVAANGGFVHQLRSAGLIGDDPSLLDCPSNGRNHLPARIPALEDLAGRGDVLDPCVSHSDFGYTLGYRNGGSRSVLPASLPTEYPLLGDVPPHDARGVSLEGNSPNHGGAGQNIFFAGGHMRWAPRPRLGPDPDIFHNDQGRTAPGTHRDDFVIASPVARALPVVPVSAP